MSSGDADGMDELVDSVSEGKLIDWPDVEPMDETSQLLLAALKDVARIAEFNRERQRSAPQRLPGEGARGRASGPMLFRWGHLEVLQLVGRGSFGEVYRALDTHLQREVALKLRRSEGESGVGEHRFLSEARDLAKVRHPNVVVVYGADTHDGQIGFWTDFVHGRTLKARLDAQGPMAENTATQIGVELCRALQAVHGAGLVHGDVKLANVMIDEHGRVVLMDFGAARPRGEYGFGGTVCSPLTTAPEILEGEAPRPTADLYSLGTLLFQVVSGRTPFEATSLAELHALHEQGRRAQLAELRTDLSPAFIAVLDRALSLDPDQRYQTAEEMAAAFNDALAQPLRKAYSLPAEPDLLVGRERELAELEQKLAQEARLVTLLGPAGTGKTRLAVRAGWSSLATWPGGVWLCDLSEARDLDRILSVVAGALAVPLAKGEPIEQLGRAIAARRRCLVVLDNFEHGVEFAEATVGRWLELAPSAHFLATSRERLRVRGETVQAVEPLAVADAAQLFLERARQQAPETELSGSQADAVRELVTMVDGLPLAIELAAARITIMSPSEILGRMRDRFRVLSRAGVGGGKSGGGRHSTLEAAIDGSWDLLPPWEKVAFAQCAVFQGGFTLEAAENVLDLSLWPDAPWVVDVVQSLVDKSLLRVGAPAASRTSAAAAEARIGMYASLQDYARQKLGRLSSDGAAVTAAEIRHGAWYARYGTDEAIAALDHRGGMGRARRLEHEFDNLVAACRRALARRDGPVAAQSWRAADYVLNHRGRTTSAMGLAEEVAALVEGEARFHALISLSNAERLVGQMERSHAAIAEAFDIARAADDRRLIALAFHARGVNFNHQGRMEEAHADYHAVLALLPCEDPLLEQLVMGSIGVNHLLFGEMPKALEYLEKSVQMAREQGARAREGNALGNLAIVAAEQGRIDEARQIYEEALAIHRETGNRFDEANHLGNYANLLSDQGRLAEARVHYQDAVAIAREIGERRIEGIVLGNLGTLEAEEGRTEEAAAHFQTALAIAREMKNRRSEGYALEFLAELQRGNQERSAAHANFDLALAIARELQNRRLEGVTLTGLASLLGDEGRFEEARSASARAEAILQEVGDRSSLGSVMCGRAELEAQAGNVAAATSALGVAEALADEVGAANGSLLRRRLTQLRATLPGVR